MLDENFVKKYFRKEGTVSKWWNPTEGEYAYLFENQLKIIKKWLKKEKKSSCLEVSCGKGRVTKEIASNFCDYLATDISCEMLSIAKKFNISVKFEIQDAENLNVDSGSKDAIICLEALVHYSNPRKAIEEFYRVLKPNGILILDYDNKYSIRRLIKKTYQFFERSNKQFGENIFNPYSKNEAIKMIKKSGFKIESIQYLGVISPVNIHKKDGSIINVISKNLAEKFHKLDFDKIPILNRFGTYHLVLARK
jgi:ubiquinone/menaquinone biosynthesis C-methylase UbiE